MGGIAVLEQASVDNIAPNAEADETTDTPADGRSVAVLAGHALGQVRSAAKAARKAAKKAKRAAEAAGGEEEPKKKKKKKKKKEKEA